MVKSALERSRINAIGTRLNDKSPGAFTSGLDFGGDCALMGGPFCLLRRQDLLRHVQVRVL